MQEILKSTLLDFKKSFFYVNFIKHTSGEKYVSIEQTFASNYKKQRVTLKSSDLEQLITVLENYKSETFTPDPFKPRNYFSKEKQRSIVKIYLKGVPINDIALQFDCSPEIIKNTLIHEGVFDDDKEARKIEMIRLSKLKY
jgi:hypothetical protein